MWAKMVALGVNCNQLLISILEQRPHEWTNVAEPNHNDRTEVAAHDGLQLRCLRELWKPIAIHHMTVTELPFDNWSVLDPSFATHTVDLASNLLDLLLSADMDYDLKDNRVALRWVEVVCHIAKVSGDLVERILMKETRWLDYRQQFWWSLCGPSGENVYEALPRGAFHTVCVAPFLWAKPCDACSLSTDFYRQENCRVYSGRRRMEGLGDGSPSPCCHC